MGGLKGDAGKDGKTGPAGSKGEKGIKGEAGNDGIGLHLKTFKVGDRYSKGDYVFEKSTRNDHEEKTMYIAQKSFTADVEPYKNKNGAWAEFHAPKGEKGEKGTVGKDGDTGAQGPAGKDGADGTTGPEGKQ